MPLIGPVMPADPKLLRTFAHGRKDPRTIIKAPARMTNPAQLRHVGGQGFAVLRGAGDPGFPAAKRSNEQLLQYRPPDQTTPQLGHWNSFVSAIAGQHNRRHAACLP
jgi:hypothetical protein